MAPKKFIKFQVITLIGIHYPSKLIPVILQLITTILFEFIFYWAIRLSFNFNVNCMQLLKCVYNLFRLLELIFSLVLHVCLISMDSLHAILNVCLFCFCSLFHWNRCRSPPPRTMIRSASFTCVNNMKPHLVNNNNKRRTPHHKPAPLHNSVLLYRYFFFLI